MSKFRVKLPFGHLSKDYYLESVIHDSISYTNAKAKARVFTDSPQDKEDFLHIELHLNAWAMEYELEYLETEL